MRNWLIFPVVLFSAVLSCWVYETSIEAWFETPRDGWQVDRFGAFFLARHDAPLVIGSSRAQSIIPWMLSSNAVSATAGDLPLQFLAALLERLKNTRPDHNGLVIIDLSEKANRSHINRTYATDADLLVRFPEVRKVLRRNHGLDWYYDLPGLRYFGGNEFVFINVVRSLRYRLLRECTTGYPHWFIWIPFEFDPKIGPPAPKNSEAAFKARLARQQLTEAELPDPPNEEDITYFSAAVRELSPRRVVITRVPIHPKYREFIGPVEADMKRILDSLAKLPNVTILDYSGSAYEDRCFVDYLHLNAFGAYRFSSQLIHDLEKAGIPMP